VAIEARQPDDELAAVVARIREEIRLAGEDRLPPKREDAEPLPREVRDAVMRLLRDGTYHAAAARVGAEDPELADQ